MKSLFAACAVGVAAGCFAVPASAADFTIPQYDWSGPYVGMQFGYGFGKDHIHDNNAVSGFTDYRSKFSIDGITGGLHGGYNKQFERIVLGLEADAEFSDINGKNPNWPFGDGIRSDSKSSLDFQGSLRLRTGYAFDRIMIYGTGGIALGDINSTFYDSVGSDHFSKLKTGWTVGGGLEYSVNDAWSLRAEYRYTEFSKLRGLTTNTDPGWYENDALHFNEVRIGGSYHF
jgi:outer membrane immunogenic protein